MRRNTTSVFCDQRGQIESREVWARRGSSLRGDGDSLAFFLVGGTKSRGDGRLGSAKGQAAGTLKKKNPIKYKTTAR